MKVLFLGRQFHPLVGGTESVMLECARGLRARGHELRVLTLDRNLFDGEVLPHRSEFEGIEIFRISFVGPGFKPIPRGRTGIWAQLRWADVIHIFDLRFLLESAILARAVLRKPLLITTNGFILHQRRAWWAKQAVFRGYLKPLLGLSDRILASSRQDWEKLADRYERPKLELMELGVNLERFSGVRRRPVKGRILHWGRLDRHKGVDLLLHALAELKGEWELDLVYGSAKPETEQSLRELGRELGLDDRIRWCGKLGEPELLRKLEEAWVAVFPSRYEGFGLTLVEALAAGVPVLANDIDAFRNILGDAGWRADFKNTAAASRELERILSLNPTDLDQPELKAHAATFSWETRVARLDSIYRELAAVGPVQAEASA